MAGLMELGDFIVMKELRSNLFLYSCFTEEENGLFLDRQNGLFQARGSICS